MKTIEITEQNATLTKNWHPSNFCEKSDIFIGVCSLICVMEGATSRAQIKFQKNLGSWNGPCQDARKIAKPKEFVIIWGSSNNAQKSGK